MLADEETSFKRLFQLLKFSRELLDVNVLVVFYSELLNCSNWGGGGALYRSLSLHCFCRDVTIKFLFIFLASFQVFILLNYLFC